MSYVLLLLAKGFSSLLRRVEIMIAPAPTKPDLPGMARKVEDDFD
jgi:hypothetical protein